MENLEKHQAERFDKVLQRLERVENKLGDQADRGFIRSSQDRREYTPSEIRRMANEIMTKIQARQGTPDVHAQRIMFTSLPMNVKKKLQKKIRQRTLRNVDQLHKLLVEAMMEEMC